MSRGIMIRIGLLILALIVPFLPFITDYVLHIIILIYLFMILSLGLNIVPGFNGLLDLGYVGFYGIGAYVSAILTVHFQLNPWLCMLIGMIIASAVAVLVGVPSLKLRGHYLAMATLAFGIIVFIVFNEEVEWTGGPDGLPGIPGLSIFGFEFDSMIKYYYLVWFFVFAAFIFTINVIQSRTGRALRAIHISEAASSAMGVNVPRFKIMVFVYSAILASLAGSLYAHYLNFINPSTFDLFFSIKLIIMIALGGMHDIWGAIIGAFLITFLSFEWLHFFEEYEIIVYGAILLLVTMFLPHGLVGIPGILRGWFRR